MRQRHRLGGGSTYYAVLSIFPALIALVSVLGLVGRVRDPAADRQSGDARSRARRKQILTDAIQNLQATRAAGLVFVVGLAARSGPPRATSAAFMRASNAIWDVAEGRPIWKTLPLRLGVTARDAAPAGDQRDRGRRHRPAGPRGR